MIPRLKWYERLLCWLLFRIEAKHGLRAGFDEIDDYWGTTVECVELIDCGDVHRMYSE